MNKKMFLFSLLIILFLPVAINAQSNFLYDVIKNESESNGLAREYIGEHQDSMDSSLSTKKIYHWYASNDEEAAQINEKNNVLFAGHCWQMLRTTDTGGVKLIYNGEYDSTNKCNDNRTNHVGYTSAGTYYNTIIDYLNVYYYGSDYIYDKDNDTFQLSGEIKKGNGVPGDYTCKTEEQTCSTLYYLIDVNGAEDYYGIPLSGASNYSQYGTIKFNEINRTPASVGYMYENAYHETRASEDWVYGYGERELNYVFPVTYVTGLVDSITNSSSIRVGSIITKNEDGTYTITGEMPIPKGNWPHVYMNYKGRFICENNTNTCEEPRYMVSTTSLGYKYINVTQELLVGKSYNDSGITEIENIPVYELLKNGSSYEDYKYVCQDHSNSCTTDKIRRISKYTDQGYKYYMITYYGKSVTYDEVNKKYILNDIVDTEALLNPELLNTHHYSCVNKYDGYALKECDSVVYIYALDRTEMYYIRLTDGVKNIDEALDNMFKNNKYPSSIMSGIEGWYKKYLLKYDSNIDDVIYCNDRSYADSDEFHFLESGLRENGGNFGLNENGYTGYERFIPFKGYNLSGDLSCTNITDQFSVSNSKAKLNYKVGLATSSEMYLLNSDILRLSGQRYWLGTPSIGTDQYGNSFVRGIDNEGLINNTNTSVYSGLRPVISLKSNIEFGRGTGEKTNPYDIVEKHSINVVIKNETKDLNINLDDLTSVFEDENVIFKVTPIKGYKVTNIEVKDTANNNIDYQETDNVNEYTFIMPDSDVTIIPSYEKVSNEINVEDNKNTKEITISVNDVKAVVYEETVRFTVVPEEGYEVENIIITDENGNNITYRKTDKENEYEFTMPDTDVLIKPVYRKIDNTPNNPKTGKNYLFVFFILILGLVTILKHKKRLN